MTANAKRSRKARGRQRRNQGLAALANATLASFSGHVPSPQEILDKMTPAGAWTAKQLAEWGVGWPPLRGWRETLATRYQQGLPGAVIPPAKPGGRVRLQSRNPAREKQPAAEVTGQVGREFMSTAIVSDPSRVEPR